MQVPGGAIVLVSCDEGLANTKCDRLLLKSAYPVLGSIKDFPFDGLILAGCPLGTAEIVAQLPQGGGR
jgi:homoserine trans-succinylase